MVKGAQSCILAQIEDLHYIMIIRETEASQREKAESHSNTVDWKWWHLACLADECLLDSKSLCEYVVHLMLNIFVVSPVNPRTARRSCNYHPHAQV